jgi:hypothetical protein
MSDFILNDNGPQQLAAYYLQTMCMYKSFNYISRFTEIHLLQTGSKDQPNWSVVILSQFWMIMGGKFDALGIYYENQ